jgi:hypothetical protein
MNRKQGTWTIRGDKKKERNIMRNGVCRNHIALQLELKKSHIQLLCNYPLDITTSMQLSHWKYGELINKLPC